MPEQMWSKPRYFTYYKLPTKVIPREGGGEPLVWRFDNRSGGWKENDEILVEIESNSRAELSTLDRERFIDITEWFRARYRLRTEGPMAALYETLLAVRDQAERDNRPLTDNERALIHGLSRKTYAMFERELAARGDPGADPSPES